MRIKKFNNLWTMGLIICAVLLVVIYLLKLIVPSFVVGVAEVDFIVRFGEYIDSHEWAYYIYTFITSFATYFVYTCACARKKCLNWKDCILVSAIILLLFGVQLWLPDYYLALNMLSLVAVPALVIALDKRTDVKYLYSLTICFTIEMFAEILSVLIRDIPAMITYPNSATYTILLIDVFIWEVLLYNYYNYKEDK